MEFAVNYSRLLAELVREGLVQVDRFKCPAWPDLLKEAQQTRPVYVHFPLTVGSGLGSPQDDEKKEPADLERIADLLVLTGTYYVNTHLVVSGKHYPGIAFDSRAPRHIDRVVSGALRDLEPLIKRFGAQRILVENVINEYGWLTIGVLPEVLSRIFEETGCGFLFDLSHARLTARRLGLDERQYAASLPVEAIREIHVTGLQVLEGDLLQTMLAAGDPLGMAQYMAGQEIDHLPMLDADWLELEWLADEIRAGKFGDPWVVAYEYGGVGHFWEEITSREVYLSQLPRMAAVLEQAHGM